MISAFCGCVDDRINFSPIRGNGKTMAETYAGFQDFLAGKTIISNYHLNFLTFNQKAEEYFNSLSFKEQLELKSRIRYMSVKEMVDLILNSGLNDFDNGVTLLIDEIQTVLNSLGTSAKQINFFDKMQSQTRKRNTDVYYATQRLANVHKRIRVQTDNKFICEKIHKNPYQESEIYEVCYSDSCQEDHLIHVMNYDNFNMHLFIDCSIYGLMYNTKEIIDEDFTIEKS